MKLSEITIIPQSSLASPLEINIKISSCAKLILESTTSSDIIIEYNDADNLGLVSKISTSTVYLLKKNRGDERDAIMDPASADEGEVIYFWFSYVISMS